MSTTLSSPVRLTLPAHADYVAIARGVLLIASGRAGITIDGAEDLALAVDEMCAALLGAGATGELEVVVEAGDGALSVGVTGTVEGDWPPAGWEDEAPAMILEALVDQVEFRRDRAAASIVVEKAADAVPG